jgi:hypothetical protein
MPCEALQAVYCLLVLCEREPAKEGKRRNDKRAHDRGMASMELRMRLNALAALLSIGFIAAIVFGIV